MTESTDSAVISDAYRVPIVAQKRDDGGVVIRGPHRIIVLSDAELDRLIAFTSNRARLMRHKPPEATKLDP